MPDETEVELESTEAVDNPEASEQTEVDEGPVEPEQMYTIKVDGEETQIPQSELVNGYQRQADYTRKTQELSAERERLQQAEAIVSALESNPEETLKVLARSFDIDTPAPSEVQGSEDWEEETPTDKRLTELEGKIARQDLVTLTVTGLSKDPRQIGTSTATAASGRGAGRTRTIGLASKLF